MFLYKRLLCEVLSATPQLQLETLFVLNKQGRIVSTREPQPSPGPAFMLIRGAASLAWAVRADVTDAVVDEVGEAVRQEPFSAYQEPPVYARRYQALLPGRVRWGPAFEFPELTDNFPGVVSVHDEAPLQRHFSGWVAGHPVSVCGCSRRSAVAAEAGLETAPAFRGRGYAPRVTAAWAVAVRALGRVPLYSTEWNNLSSLAVAHKVGLKIYATDWSIFPG